MPILIMALIALGAFVVIGLMLFSAVLAESRQQNRAQAAAADIPRPEPPAPERPKARAAHA